MGSYTQYAMSKSYPTRQRLYGSDDFFDSALIKSNVLIMGSCELNGKHDIFMAKGKECLHFYGHDRKTFSIRWRAPTVLDLHLIRLPINK
jgi:hypothetical protein